MGRCWKCQNKARDTSADTKSQNWQMIWDYMDTFTSPDQI